MQFNLTYHLKKFRLRRYVPAPNIVLVHGMGAKLSNTYSYYIHIYCKIDIIPNFLRLSHINLLFLQRKLIILLTQLYITLLIDGNRNILWYANKESWWDPQNYGKIFQNAENRVWGSPASKGNFISICKCIALMIGMDKKTVLIRRRYVQMYV